MLGVGHGREAVTTAKSRPRVVQNAAGGPAGTRPRPATIVLQAAVDIKWHGIVDRYAIPLRQRQRRHEEKLVAAIVADTDAAVVQLDDVSAVFRIDPYKSIITVRSRTWRRESLAAIIAERVCVQHVDALVVVRIDDGLAGVHRTWIPVAHERPRSAFVVAAINAGLADDVRRGRVVTLPLFDADVNNVRILAIDRDADATVFSGRQAIAREFGPRRASVGALPERAAWATAVEAVRAATTLIRRRV